MENSQKALVLGAAFFLAIAIITIAVAMFVSASEATKAAQTSFTGIQEELASTAFTVYDNTIVSGSQVVNALRKFADRDQFGIWVRTGTASTGNQGYWYINELDLNAAMDSAAYASVNGTGSDMKNVLDESDDEYVNPSGKFEATIVRDTSNVIRGIKFTQQ